MAVGFPFFSCLPAELRIQIWKSALPDQIQPALSFYKEGCWLFRELTPSDEDYDPNPDLNLYFEFRPEMLDVIQLKLPLYSVNREARSIALGWARRNNVDVRSTHDASAHIFTCLFDSSRDVLYVAPDNWDGFNNEPTDQMFQPHMLDRQIMSGSAEVKHIAVPAERLKDESIPVLVETLVSKISLYLADSKSRTDCTSITVESLLSIRGAVNYHRYPAGPAICRS